MAPAVQRAVRHVPAGAGRCRCRGAGCPHPGWHRSGRGRDRTGFDGAGRHLVHGRRLGCAPESGGERGVRAAPRLRVARVPGYVLAQLVGATLACLVLRATFGTAGQVGATVPGPGFGATQAVVVEGLLTLGLVSVILGTASTAQNIGSLSGFGVGAYIVLAGLWASPVSGASMNPARSFGPDVVRGDVGGCGSICSARWPAPWWRSRPPTSCAARAGVPPRRRPPAAPSPPSSLRSPESGEAGRWA